MSLQRATVRRARKLRQCDVCRRPTIHPGEHYVEHVVAPDHNDLGNEHWWRMAECSACCDWRGRPIGGSA